MESILVTVLVGCFVLVMAPAVFVALLDAESVNREANGMSAPVAPLAVTGGREPEERMAA